MLDGMWTFLLVGCFGAIGAALCLGTLAALVRFHRTGRWPGPEAAAEISTPRLLLLWLRVVVGGAVAAWAFVSLARDGLLGL